MNDFNDIRTEVNVFAETPLEVAENAYVLQRAVVDGPGAEQLGVLASPNATSEEHYLLQKLMRGLGFGEFDPGSVPAAFVHGALYFLPLLLAGLFVAGFGIANLFPFLLSITVSTAPEQSDVVGLAIRSLNGLVPFATMLIGATRSLVVETMAGISPM